MIVASLANRYRKREMTRSQFMQMAAIFGGAKAVKIGLIVAALSIPGLNAVAGAYLVFKMIHGTVSAYRM